MPHNRLLLKIKAHGIDGKILDWIQSWLSNRKQRVVLNGYCSDWVVVLSGVPQGSVLGPLLFLLFINDIDRGLNSNVLKFADDMKLFRNVSDLFDIDKLRNDLVKLCDWSIEWLMLFNIEKCKVLHFGRNNLRATYVMDGKVLDDLDVERDLGVLISSDLKVNKQCCKVVNTANRILGMINRTFTCKTSAVILPLYKSLVRPHLEYCVQVWRPYLMKDIDLIEKVQHRATRMMVDLKGLTYEKRLSTLNLTTLETRRLRGDMIETFKILKGFEHIEGSKFFRLSDTSLRGHSFKLYKPRCHLNIRKFAFSCRVIDEWNMLDQHLIDSDSINTFKNNLDKHLFYRGFI